MNSDKFQARRKEIERLEERLQRTRAQIQEKRRQLAAEELLQIKEQLDTLGLPLEDVLAKLREIAGEGGPPHERERYENPRTAGTD